MLLIGLNVIHRAHVAHRPMWLIWLVWLTGPMLLIGLMWLMSRDGLYCSQLSCSAYSISSEFHQQTTYVFNCLEYNFCAIYQQYEFSVQSARWPLMARFSVSFTVTACTSSCDGVLCVQVRAQQSSHRLTTVIGTTSVSCAASVTCHWSVEASYSMVQTSSVPAACPSDLPSVVLLHGGR